MKTFEGIITIKWYKNDNGGDRRPITIDISDGEILNTEIKRIKSVFMTKGENNKLPYSVKIEVFERK